MKIKENQKLWLILPMRSLLFIAAFLFCSAVTKKHLTELTNIWSILASAMNIVTIGVLWIVCRRSGITYRQLVRFEKREKRAGKDALFIFFMLLIGMGGMYLAGALCYGEFPYLAPMMIAPVPRFLAVLNIFVLPLTTTVAEDGLYLGCVVNRFPSKWAAVLIPAFFYALQHSFIPTIFDMKYIAYRFLSFLPLTLWICYLYQKGSSIVPIMAGHGLLNLATTIQIAVTSFHPEAYAMLTGQ